MSYRKKQTKSDVMDWYLVQHRKILKYGIFKIPTPAKVAFLGVSHPFILSSFFLSHPMLTDQSSQMKKCFGSNGSPPSSLFTQMSSSNMAILRRGPLFWATGKGPNELGLNQKEIRRTFHAICRVHFGHLTDPILKYKETLWKIRWMCCKMI
jgi:hypothetical protein